MTRAFTAIFAEAPVMTRGEFRLEDDDKNHGRHWPEATCWCGAAHDGTETGMTFTAPPWDESRSREVA